MDAYEQNIADREQIEKFDPFDFSDIDEAAKEQGELFYAGSPKPDPEENNEALPIEQRLSFLRDDVLAINRDVQELLTILRPLAPLLASLPELAEKIDPLLEGLRTSPVLKMMGVKF